MSSRGVLPQSKHRDRLVRRSRFVSAIGECGGPLVHGTNVSDAGQESASRKFKATNCMRQWESRCLVLGFSSLLKTSRTKTAAPQQDYL